MAFIAFAFLTAERVSSNVSAFKGVNKAIGFPLLVMINSRSAGNLFQIVDGEVLKSLTVTNLMPILLYLIQYQIVTRLSMAHNSVVQKPLLPPPQFTAGTAQHVNVGTAGLVKKPGHKEFFFPEDRPADRADPAALSLQAVDAAGNVHEPVVAPQGRECRGLNPFTPFQPGAADRAGPGRAGEAFTPGTGAPAFPPEHGHGNAARDGKKQVEPEPEEDHPRQCKKHYLNKRSQFRPPERPRIHRLRLSLLKVILKTWLFYTLSAPP